MPSLDVVIVLVTDPLRTVLVMAYGAILTCSALPMTIEAPAHFECRVLVDLGHFVHRTMAFQALLVRLETLEDALVGIHMSVMREPHEAREFMHFDPLDGTPFIPRRLHLLYFWVPRPGQEVTTHARRHRRKARARADFRREVTIPAIHLVLDHVDIVPK